MKKSTLAVAALLTTLSAATIVPMAYAEDVAAPAPTTNAGCAGKTDDAAKAGCAGKTDDAAKAADAAKTDSTGSDS